MLFLVCLNFDLLLSKITSRGLWNKSIQLMYNINKSERKGLGIREMREWEHILIQIMGVSDRL